MIYMNEKVMDSLYTDLEKCKQFLDAITDMVLIKREKSRIVWANKAFRDYYGMDNEKLKGMIDSSISEPDYTQQYIKDDEQVFSSGNSLDIPVEPVVRFDGVTRFFHTVKSAIRDTENNVIMTIGVSRDITDEREAQELISKRNKELEELNELMVGRELKMTELKKEIANLKAQLVQK